MNAFHFSVVAVLVSCATAAGGGRNTGPAAAGRPAPKPAHPSLVEVGDAAGLPRVLLIGDSISMGYTLPVKARLKGEANVHRPAENCGNTARGLANMDAWLGDEKVYNAATLEVMRERDVAVDDLCAHVVEQQRNVPPRPLSEKPAGGRRPASRPGEIQLPFDVHFTPKGCDKLADQVAQSIRNALSARP